MAIIRATDTASFLAALKSASGGDTIVLADGDYGSVELKGKWTAKNIGKYDSPVTVISETPGGAVFDRLTVTDGGNLSFDGLTLNGAFGAFSSTNISISNSTGTHVYMRNVDGATITGNHMSGGATTLGLDSVQNFTVTDNIFEHSQSDLIQVSRNSYNGLIENNILRDPIVLSGSAHPDMIQIFGWDGWNPHDITIRGNYLYDDPATGKVLAQGIFLSNPTGEGFRNILIEENLVSVRSPNTIFVSGGEENVVIRDNSLIAGPEGYKGGTIRLVANGAFDGSGVTVENNIAVGVINEGTAATIKDNVFYGSHLNAPGIFQGTGAQWQDFVPRDMNGIGTAGARDKLEDLMGHLDKPEAARDPMKIATMRNLDLTGNLALPSIWSAKIDDIGHIAHNAALETAEGTIAFSFAGSSLSWARGLFSKDALGLGNGLSAWNNSGTLHVTFEDDQGVQKITHAGLKSGVEYDLQISFGDGIGRVWLDGGLIGEVQTDMDWTRNFEEITIGANNSSSTSGTHDKMRNGFAGDINGFTVYDQAMTPEELLSLRERPLPTDTQISDTGSVQRVMAADALDLTGRLSLPASWKGKVDDIGHIAHDASLEISEGTLTLSFEGESMSWRRGLLSKDAAGSNHGMTVWNNSGTLHISFEDDDSIEYISHKGLKAGVEYDLQISFGDGKAQAWLGDALIGEVRTDMDWTRNVEEITIGAENSRSTSGTHDSMQSAFFGTIDNVAVYDHAMTPAELQALLSAQGNILL